MGIVFLATQMPLGRQVAIKLLLPQIADKDFRKRFLLEASISAQLVQRHIVTVHDFGESEDGSLFMAMEYLDGESLSKAIKREVRLDSARTCSISVQICRALRAAHAKGVVHRDLKPSNIMLLRDEEEERLSDFVKVLDFGLGKVVESGLGNLINAELTGAGALLGSPNYMAPEQIRCGPIDSRTDVYALGVIMFHMLAGRPPFVAESSVEVMNMHLALPIPSISEITGQVDEIAPELEVIAQRAMEKNPGDRYQSMDDLLSDLKAASRLIGSDPSQSLFPMGPGQTDVTGFDDPMSIATPVVPMRTPTPTLQSQPPQRAPQPISASRVTPLSHALRPEAPQPLPPAPGPSPLHAPAPRAAFFREAIGRTPTQLETMDVPVPPRPGSSKKHAIAIGAAVAVVGAVVYFGLSSSSPPEAPPQSAENRTPPPVPPPAKPAEEPQQIAQVAQIEPAKTAPVAEEPKEAEPAAPSIAKRAVKPRRAEAQPEPPAREEPPVQEKEIKAEKPQAVPEKVQPVAAAEETKPEPEAKVQPPPKVQEVIQRQPEPAKAAPAVEQKKAPVVVAARRVKQMPPDYPARYRDQGIEGDVKVRVTIDITGKPIEAEVVESSPHVELNYAARKAALRDMFVPATQDGKPVESKLTYVYRFRLK